MSGLQHSAIMGVDYARGAEKVAFALEDSKGLMIVDRDVLNAKNAGRKAEREYIARALIALAEMRGATVERRDFPAARPGGAEISLRFTLNGVGAMVDVDKLFGGGSTLIHWYNSEHPARDFTTRFCDLVGSAHPQRPHHKATSCPDDWFGLAMMLDAGLCLAARREAFGVLPTA